MTDKALELASSSHSTHLNSFYKRESKLSKMNETEREYNLCHDQYGVFKGPDQDCFGFVSKN